MKASELRIGNWVLYKDNFISWDYEDFGEVEHSNIEDSIKPIPLTEEWLVKLGFKSNKYNDEYSLELGSETYLLDCEYTDKGVFNFVIESVEGKGYCLPPDIKHIHELQNLYFALTNQELTIKEYERA